LRYRLAEANAATRATYFSPACSRILYGTDQQPHRWHQYLSAPVSAGIVFGAEIVLPNPSDPPSEAFAVFHLYSGAPELIETLRAIAHRRDSTAAPPDFTGLLPAWVTLKASAKVFTVAFLTSTAGPPPMPPDPAPVAAWSNADQWLWQLASRTTCTDFPPDPDHADELLTGTIALSADWRGLVARDGAAFLALRADQGNDDPYLGFAQYYAHAPYTDALIIGMIQNTTIATLIDETALAFDAKDLTRHLARLETRVAKFRTIYWLRDASTHSHANDLLTAYQAQHHLPAKFDAVLNEIADLNRIAQTQEGQRVGAALGILTVVGLPYGAALAILQVLGASTWHDLLIGMAAATAGTSALLLTRLGRLLLRSLRALDS
jgi:hypothetical protein